MENQVSPYQQYIPRLILQCLEELAIGLKPFDDKDKVIIVERIIPFAQARYDGKEYLRKINEKSFIWIVKTYRKKAKQLNDSKLPEYFFNGSYKFFPELKEADAPEGWIGFELEQHDFDDYLLRLNTALMNIRDNLYMRLDPETEKEEPEEIRVHSLSLKQTALYFYYLDRAYHFCEDKNQLALIASQVSGHGKDNLYKKILSPLGKDLDGDQSRKNLERDILAVKKLFECSGKELGLKYIEKHLDEVRNPSGSNDKK